MNELGMWLINLVIYFCNKPSAYFLQAAKASGKTCGLVCILKKKGYAKSFYGSAFNNFYIFLFIA